MSWSIEAKVNGYIGYKVMVNVVSEPISGITRYACKGIIIEENRKNNDW